MTLGLGTAAADEPEAGGGGEAPPVETPAEPPAEVEPPPTETPPTEPETTTESPKVPPELPAHPPETTIEAPSQGGGASPSTAPSQAPVGSSPAPARHQGSSGTTPRSPPPTSGGTGKGIRVTNPLDSIGAGVDSIFSGALAPKQLDRVGRLLADSGLAPRGNKRAQHRAARKIINALGAAALGSGIGLSPPQAPPAAQPIPFVPIHGGPQYLPIALLVLLLAGVGAVLFFQLRPVIRSRQPRPPLISSLDAGPATGSGPSHVSLPREPARAPERPSPGRRKTR
jgi:hypothetical protein